jgi:hypothetical protein
VAGPGVILESSAYAGYALEKWHMREKFLDLPSPAGKRRIYVRYY